jgi:cation diffusion facilitator family transporter
MSAGGSTGQIITSLLVNVAIAIAKSVAAFITGSGAMLAEAIHSSADCGNQLLLLRGNSEAKKPPDESHPLGYGRNVYFWSFMVALLLFSGGGVFSIYEGVHKLSHPEPVENLLLAIGILGFSLLLEGWATIGNIRELNKRRGTVSFIKYLRDTKDSDLVVVFGENAAAVMGLVVAMAAIGISEVTGDARADAIGSIVVGLVLVAVAIFLSIEVKSLLVGEAADPQLAGAARSIALEDKRITEVRKVVAVQQGPGEVLVAMKISCSPTLPAKELSDLINEFEVRLRKAKPECHFVYVEPDL